MFQYLHYVLLGVGLGVLPALGGVLLVQGDVMQAIFTGILARVMVAGAAEVHELALVEMGKRALEKDE